MNEKVEREGGAYGGGNMLCYNCGEEGHMVSYLSWLNHKDQAERQSRDCVNERVAGVGGGGGTCYNCGEAGHMVCVLPGSSEHSANDSHATVPRPLSQAHSEVNATIVAREDIK